jgi:hypothetical protein
MIPARSYNRFFHKQASCLRHDAFSYCAAATPQLTFISAVSGCCISGTTACAPNGRHWSDLPVPSAVKVFSWPALPLPANSCGVAAANGENRS